jgi:ATP-dependent helicase HrpB
LGNAPVLSSEGRAFPVEVLYRPHTERFASDAVVACIHAALREQSGSLLVFLPGAGEIHRVAERLSGNLPADVVLAPLYGNLKSGEQGSARLCWPRPLPKPA